MTHEAALLLSLNSVPVAHLSFFCGGVSAVALTDEGDLKNGLSRDLMMSKGSK